MTVDTLYQIDLFAGISATEMDWLLANSQLIHLNNGEYFIREGDTEVKFAVVLEGEMQVTRQVQGAKTVVGTTPRGICCGQLNLLNGTPAEQTIQAILPCTLLVFEPDAFRGIFGACPKVGSRILRIAAERMAMFASQETQQQKMAALGKLSAGLAHELNNPAAAAQRAAQLLQEALPVLQLETMKLNSYDFTPDQLDTLRNLQQGLMSPLRYHSTLNPLERSDLEESMGSWLDEHEVANSWKIAAVLVNVGITVEELETLYDQVGAPVVPAVITWLSHLVMAAELLDDVGQSTKRISDLVGAIKEYTYMDRAPITEAIDLQRGLETTLRVLNHKLKNVNVIRDYDPTLPAITGNGSDLNQVWTNLIDNAIDAMKNADKRTLQIVTRNEVVFAMVEISDNGSGIPADVLPHIFDPFFTTKDVGAGTGLGLDISYRVVRQHNGTMEVQSEPGRTRFIVRLPIADKR